MEEKMEENKQTAQDIPVSGPADEAEAPQAAETPADEAQKKIDELTEQYQQMREIAARAQADGINYRNWAEREFKRLKAFGSERAVLAMLPVLDNLELALGSADADPASIKEGVRMVRTQFADALKNLGVTELDVAGKPFSPMEHDAMGMVPVTDKAQDGLIQTVVRKGFAMSDKVIRPAMVMVGRYTEPQAAEGPKEEQQ